MARKTTKSLSGLPEDIQQSLERRWNIKYDIHQPFTLSDVHSTFLELLLYEKTKMVLVDGPAGSAKTYLAVLAALLQLSSKDCDKIVYIRSIVESASRSLGSLPGDIAEKFQPWSMPLSEKLEELLKPQDVQHLFKHHVQCLPVNFARGLTFKNSTVIIDEAQNMTLNELTTVLTRFGHYSKYIILGDARQSDINGRSGFEPILNAFNNEESESRGIHTFQFGKAEIVRAPILQHIVEVLESIPKMK